ncbi:LysR family transcriptional regulator [Eggerthella sinensis]|uniref:LysR family transcriptional regulator n=1 Tax=Eggerthella sinensis TaxID=242230 RepID=UPI0022E676F0|nr:LysR family transcriptional regulator [Eggerthella sinensis]
MFEYSREFVVLARRLNFSEAALELNVSQPSLSRHIAELERELGFKLLERNPVSLTVAGKHYLEVAGTIIEMLDQAIACGRSIEQGSNSLSVSFLPADSFISDIAYEALAEMRAQMPSLTFRVVAEKASSAYDLAARGEADVAILSHNPGIVPEGYTCEWLVDNLFDVWVHKDNPLLSARSVCVQDVKGYYLITSTNRLFDSWTEGSKAALRNQGIEPKTHLKSLDSLNDFAFSIQPDEYMVAERNNRDPSARYNSDLVPLRFTSSDYRASNYLLYRTDTGNPLVKKFTEACRRIASERYQLGGV